MESKFTRTFAERNLIDIQAELLTVVEGVVAEVGEPLSGLIRAAKPEALDRLLAMSLPEIISDSKVIAKRVVFGPTAIRHLVNLAYIFAYVLMENVTRLEWRIGDDPTGPERYVYQNHVVLGRLGADEEVDPFAIITNVGKRAVREGGAASREMSQVYEVWAKRFNGI
jgi:hypothetical protein